MTEERPMTDDHHESPVLPRRSSVALVGILLPFLVAMALCAFASIWPVRLDARALQDLSRVQSLGLPQSSGEFVFLSRDNSIESARTATFGLRQLAFPDGSVFWAALKEHCNGPWSGGFEAIDQAGKAFVVSGGADGDWQWEPISDYENEARERIMKGVVVYDSQATRALFELRWPFVKAGGRVTVLTDATASSAFKLRRPANEFTLTRIGRIAAVSGSYVAVLLVLIQFPSLRRVDSWVISSGSIFLALGLNISLAYLLQWVAPAVTHFSPAILWAGLLLAAVFGEPKRERSGRDFFFQLPSSRAVRLVSVYCVVVYALLFLVRLDFDGDFFNNWLPQARFHYLLGMHDPAAIIGQGTMQGASYPPGYGIVLSTLMWASGMRPKESFLIGPESSFAILMYRLFIFALNAALLILVVIYLRQRGAGKPAVWMACIAVTLLLIPTTAGKHIASETVLFPMLAASIVMISAGQKLEVPALTTMGLGVGGMATLIKWEAALIFGLAVLPWLVSSLQPSVARPSRATRLRWAGALALSLMPVVVWKTTLAVHNEFFVPMTWNRFVSSVHLLPSLAGRAARGLLDDGRFLFLFLALPCATVLRFLTSRWTALPVPFGIVSLVAGFVVIFLFANMDSNTYLDNSYSRLVMVPTFGAILYCADALGAQASLLPRVNAEQ
jgi:hypothetical protein